MIKKLHIIYCLLLVSITNFAQPTIISKDLNEGARMGRSVSSDGNVLAIGAPGENTNGTNSGAVFVYEKIGEEWVYQKTLFPFNAKGEFQFGIEVSVSNGKIAVACPFQGSQASVYVFKKSADDWVFEQYIQQVYTSFEAFGYSLDLLGDNLVIGASRNGKSGADSGKAYFYQFSEGAWSLKQTIDCPDAYGSDYFAYSVALSTSYIAIGAYGKRKAYIYDYSGALVSTLNHDLESWATNNFGTSIAISDDYVVVGAGYEKVIDGDETYYYNGSAYVFDVSDWSLTQKIIPDSKGESLNFGIEGIALSNTDLLIVTSRVNEKLGVYHYQLNSGNWEFVEKFAPVAGTEPNTSIYYNTLDAAINGNEMIIGDAYAYDQTDVHIGKVFIYPIDFPTEVTDADLQKCQCYYNGSKLIVSSDKHIDYVEVYNLLGNKVYEVNVSGSELSLQLPSLNAGLYVVTFNKGVGYECSKVMVD